MKRERGDPVGRYIGKRIVQILPVLFIISFIVFFLVRLSGDPVNTMLPPEATPADRAEMRTALGLDRPLLEQYGIFLNDVVHGRFGTSLRYGQEATEVVLEKLMKNEKVKKYPEDEELLEDVIIENKQAIEMANIYSGNLNVTTEAVASVISNNLNIVMKLLTTITLVMAIPTMVASFYGMNVRGIPFAEHPHGFWIVLGFTAVVSMVVTLIFSKKDLF